MVGVLLLDRVSLDWLSLQSFLDDDWSVVELLLDGVLALKLLSDMRQEGKTMVALAKTLEVSVALHVVSIDESGIAAIGPCEVVLIEILP